MVKWEQKVLTFNFGTEEDNETFRDLNRILRQEGEDGWELVSVERHRGSSYNNHTYKTEGGNKYNLEALYSILMFFKKRSENDAYETNS